MGCEESAADTVVEDILAGFPAVGWRIRILDVANSRLLRRTTADLGDGLDMAGKKERKKRGQAPFNTRLLTSAWPARLRRGVMVLLTPDLNVQRGH